MDGVQRVSAECQRYLLDMGIDPLLWVHAMETPRDHLFYLDPEERFRLKLTTEPADGRAVRADEPQVLDRRPRRGTRAGS